MSTETTLAVGAELDAEIGTKLFEWMRVANEEHAAFVDRDGNYHGSVGGFAYRPDRAEELLPWPTFSTDIYNAWRVVEKMRERGWSFAITGVPVWSSVQHAAKVAFRRGVFPPSERHPAEAVASGAGVAEAICRCALKALAEYRGETE